NALADTIDTCRFHPQSFAPSAVANDKEAADVTDSWRTRMNRFAAIALIVFALTVGPAVHGESKLDALSVAEFLPTGFATDGSVNYQVEIQKAIDAAARDGRALIFPPMIYRLDENGVEIHSRMTLILYGAVFQIDEKCVKDGQAFIGRDVSSVRFLGGEIVGRNDVWALGVNIRGMHLSGA